MNTEQIKQTIAELCREAHGNAVAKGWWQERDDLQRAANDAGLARYCRNMIEGNLISLHHSELSEALEGIRNDLFDDKIPEFLMIEAELADCLIRIFDHAERYGYRLGDALVAKMEMNKGREIKHGGKAF